MRPVQFNSTKLNIILAFKGLASSKSIERITVGQIVEAAGISKQTFYKYFKDKFDVAQGFFLWDHASHVNENDGFIKRQMDHLTMLEENQSVYKSIMRNSYLSDSFMNRRFEYILDDLINKIGAYNINEETMLELRVILTGTEKLFEYWVMDGCRIKKETIVNVFINVIPDNLKKMMDI